MNLTPRNRRRIHPLDRGVVPAWQGLDHLEQRTLQSASPMDIAGALDLSAGTSVIYTGDNAAVVRRSSFFGSGLLDLPTGKDSDFLMLSTGKASEIDTIANLDGSQGTDLGSYGEGGDTATISFQLAVPEIARKLKFDFVFLSEEFPEFVGSIYNDFFTAQIDGVNVALDQMGNFVNINNVYFGGGESTAGTFFDGRTSLLTGSYTVPEGQDTITVELAIGDVGDGVYDSAVLLDNFRFEASQVVYLDFDGQNVGNHFGWGTSMTMDPFSAVDLGMSAGQTVAMISEIVMGITDKYAGYDISFVTTPPSTGEYATVVIGGSNDDPMSVNPFLNPILAFQLGTSTTFLDYFRLNPKYKNSRLNGQAEKIDIGNKDLSDLAVVFSGEFDKYEDKSLNTQQLIVTLAHEIAHNLGLRHVAAGPYEVMSLNTETQTKSPFAYFDDELYPLAENWSDATHQNSHQYLNSVLGGFGASSSLDQSVNPKAAQDYVTLTLPGTTKLYDVTVVIMGDDAEDGSSMFQVPQLQGALQLPVLSAQGMKMMFFGASKAGGPIDTYSGVPTKGNLELADLMQPVFDDAGNVTSSLPLAKGAPGKIKSAGAATMVESQLGDVTWLAKGTGTFTDQDGDIYTVKLTGGGSVAVQIDDADGDGRGAIGFIATENTTAKSALSITVKKAKTGDGIVTINAIAGGELKSITAKASDITGMGLDLSGHLGTLTVRDILDGADVMLGGDSTKKTTVTVRQIGDGTEMNMGSVLTKLTAAKIGDSEITAPSAGTISVTGDKKAGLQGDLAATINLTDDAVAYSLNSLVVSHHMMDADIFAVGSIKTVTTGVMFDSNVFAGVEPGVTSLPDSEFAFINIDASINTLTIKGLKDEPYWYRNSNIAAWTINKISGGYVDSYNGGTPFGVAAHVIKSASYVDETGKYSAKDVQTIEELLSLDDAIVRFF